MTQINVFLCFLFYLGIVRNKINYINMFKSITKFKMSKTKSAKKRIMISKRNYLKNSIYKSLIKTLRKKFIKNLVVYKAYPTFNNKIKVKDSLNSTYSLIDKSLKKNIFHKNNIIRKKKGLLKKYNYNQII